MAAGGFGAFTLEFVFHGDLPFFVRPRRGAERVVRRLCEKTSVKDAIEACGVPHPEIDLILVNRKPVDFSYHLVGEAKIDVFPVSAPPDLFPEHRLQERGLTKFVADGHLGKLVRGLRLFGIDVAYDRAATDAELAAFAPNEKRALLTRDRRLLMHATIRSGYYPSSQIAEEQTIEVVRRFDLRLFIAPFTRCRECNAPLEDAPREEVIDKLPDKVRSLYERFKRCPGCARVYWEGTHFERMKGIIQRLAG